MKKLTLPSELVYIVSLSLVALSVAMLTASDLGLSMVVAPAYLVSLKLDFLSFGTAEYVVQAIVFIVFCIIMRKVRPIYFTAFVSAIIYGGILDLWRLIPLFDPSVTPVGSLDMPFRVMLFAGGMLLMCFSVALSFKTYLYPQVYDYFVEKVGGKFGNKRFLFKLGFDLTFLAVSFILTFAFFGEVRAIGAGTVIMAVGDGFLIGLFEKFFDKTLHVSPLFPKFAKFFDEKEETAEKAAAAETAACDDGDVNNPKSE